MPTVPSGTSQSLLRQALRVGSEVSSGSMLSLKDNASRLKRNLLLAAKGKLFNPANDQGLGFIEGTWETLKRSVNPMNWINGIKELPNSIKQHRDNLRNGFSTKWRITDDGELKHGFDIKDAGSALLGLGMDLYGTAAPLALAFGDSEDLDTAGTFENLASRGSNVVEGLAMTDAGIKHIMPQFNNLPTMFAAPMAADMIFSPREWLRKGGKALDNFLGTGPTKAKVEDKFTRRVNDRIEVLRSKNPSFSEDEIKQQAVNDILSNGQNYLDYLNKK